MSEELAIAPVETAEAPKAEAVETVKSETVKSDVETADKSAEKNKEPTEAEKIRFAMQKRIDRLTASRSEIERKYQELIEVQKKFEDKPAVRQGEPKEADFKTAEEYLKALGKFEAEQEFSQKQAKEKQQRDHAAYQAKIEARRAIFDEKEAELRRSTPDYDEASAVFNEYVGSVDQSNPVFAVFRDVMMGMNDLPAVAYHLGKNPDVLEGLAKKDGIDLARTLFRIEYDLEKSPPAQRAKQSPKPPVEVKGAASKAKKDLSDMSPRELVKWASS